MFGVHSVISTALISQKRETLTMFLHKTIKHSNKYFSYLGEVSTESPLTIALSSRSMSFCSEQQTNILNINTFIEKQLHVVHNISPNNGVTTFDIYS